MVASSSVWSLRTMPTSRFHQPRQAFLTVAQRQAAEVLTVELQEVEGVQHGLGGAAAVERVEDRGTPSGPHTTASPSSVNDVHRRAAAVRAIAG
jgi:hypothetical protein